MSTAYERNEETPGDGTLSLWYCRIMGLVVEWSSRVNILWHDGRKLLAFGGPKDTTG